ncbi:MAG: hypothetical protein B9S33_18000 [Pedosphaera sp. Tous-C6FEB]|jgi:hypothetical protein|nr:MAG: hypothetical protein B9S33_18000 [Pedosphaera sp. Tous-C6FEB]
MLHRWFAITVALLAVAVSATAQVADSAVTHAAQLKTSLAKWEKVRDESGGDYSYQVRWSSAFGFGHTTTVTVRGNKVVERKYEVFGLPKPVELGENPPAPKPQWVESGKELGTHKNEGAAARTVDELYAAATKLLETKVPEGHQRYFGFDKQGLLNHCLVVDTRIAGDAPSTGIGPIQIQLKPTK